MTSRYTVAVLAGLAGLLLILGLMSTPRAGKPRIGEVARTQASVIGELAGVRRDLQKDLPVFRAEVVTTGPLARAGLRFENGSTLTIGAGARVALDSFVYDGDGAGAISLLKGAMRYISSKGGSSGLRFVTPFATIGIRGTDFWVGEIDGVYGVLLLRGAVVVSNDAGSVTLDEPLQGTVIYSSAAAPADPTLWPGDRRARALAGVAFN